MTAGERHPLTAEQHEEWLQACDLSDDRGARARNVLRSNYAALLARAVTAAPLAEAARHHLECEECEPGDVPCDEGMRLWQVAAASLAGSSPTAEAESKPCACEDADWDVHDEGCAASGVPDTREGDETDAISQVWEIAPRVAACPKCKTVVALPGSVIDPAGVPSMEEALASWQQTAEASERDLGWYRGWASRVARLLDADLKGAQVRTGPRTVEYPDAVAKRLLGEIQTRQDVTPIAASPVPAVADDPEAREPDILERLRNYPGEADGPDGVLLSAGRTPPLGPLLNDAVAEIERLRGGPGSRGTKEPEA